MGYGFKKNVANILLVACLKFCEVHAIQYTVAYEHHYFHCFIMVENVAINAVSFAQTRCESKPSIPVINRTATKRHHKNISTTKYSHCSFAE